MIKPRYGRSAGDEYQIWVGANILCKWCLRGLNAQNPPDWWIEQEAGRNHWGIFDDIVQEEEGVRHFFQVKHSSDIHGSEYSDEDLTDPNSNVSIKKMYDAYRAINQILNEETKFDLILYFSGTFTGQLDEILIQNSPKIEQAFIDGKVGEGKLAFRKSLSKLCGNPTDFKDFLTRLRFVHPAKDPEAEVHELCPNFASTLYHFNDFSRRDSNRKIYCKDIIRFVGPKPNSKIDSLFQFDELQLLGWSFASCLDGSGYAFREFAKLELKLPKLEETNEAKSSLADKFQDYFGHAQIKFPSSIQVEKTLNICLRILSKIRPTFSGFSEFEKIELCYQVVSRYFEATKHNSIIERTLDNLKENISNFDANFIHFQSGVNIFRVRHAEIIATREYQDIMQFAQMRLNSTIAMSPHDVPFQKNLFVENPDLLLKFERFLITKDNPGSRERIFLLLGHMGMGKTWNAYSLALKTCDKIPTFYFYLGGNYEIDFRNIFGDFEGSALLDKQDKISQILYENPNGQSGTKVLNKSMLLVFDGFDELAEVDREALLNNLMTLINHHPMNFIVLLTSRLVDWDSSPAILKNPRRIRSYIYDPSPTTISESTGSSYILDEIADISLVKEINKKYNINYENIQNESLRGLLKKPVISRILSAFLAKQNKLDQIYSKDWNSINDFYPIFVQSEESSNTILDRMGISGRIKDDFQDLISEIGDPYHGITESDLKGFQNSHPESWHVIVSSGIIHPRPRKKYVVKYQISKEYQGLIEYYISSIPGRYHDVTMCRADAMALSLITKEIINELNNLTLVENEIDKPRDSNKHQIELSRGFVIEGNRVVKLYIRSGQRLYFPQGIFKLVQLIKLDLYGQWFTQIPNRISHLRNLEELNLAYNYLQFLPQKMLKLKKLRILDLSQNKFQEVPDWWNEFSSLKTLNIHQNPIEKVPAKFKPLDEKHPHLAKYKQPLGIKEVIVIENTASIERVGLTINDNGRIISADLGDVISFPPMFWELDDLTEITIRFTNPVPFGLNSSIQTIRYKIADTSSELKIPNSIENLHSLRSLEVESGNIKDLEIPESCSRLPLKKVIIDCMALSVFRSNPLVNSKLSNLYLANVLPDKTFLSKLPTDLSGFNLIILRINPNCRVPQINWAQIRHFYTTEMYQGIVETTNFFTTSTIQRFSLSSSPSILFSNEKGLTSFWKEDVISYGEFVTNNSQFFKTSMRLTSLIDFRANVSFPLPGEKLEIPRPERVRILKLLTKQDIYNSSAFWQSKESGIFEFKFPPSPRLKIDLTPLKNLIKIIFTASEPTYPFELEDLEKVNIHKLAIFVSDEIPTPNIEGICIIRYEKITQLTIPIDIISHLYVQTIAPCAIDFVPSQNRPSILRKLFLSMPFSPNQRFPENFQKCKIHYFSLHDNPTESFWEDDENTEIYMNKKE